MLITIFVRGCWLPTEVIKVQMVYMAPVNFLVNPTGAYMGSYSPLGITNLECLGIPQKFECL